MNHSEIGQHYAEVAYTKWRALSLQIIPSCNRMHLSHAALFWPTLSPEPSKQADQVEKSLKRRNLGSKAPSCSEVRKTGILIPALTGTALPLGRPSFPGLSQEQPDFLGESRGARHLGWIDFQHSFLPCLLTQRHQSDSIQKMHVNVWVWKCKPL